MVKRVVILTGKAGSGHLSVAEAYGYWLKKWGYQADIYDVVPSLNGKILDLLYKTPATYKSLFKVSNRKMIAQVMAETVLPEIEKNMAKKVPNLSSADLIISTYPMIRPRQEKSLKIMLLLDPTVHAAYFSDPQPDFYLSFWQKGVTDGRKFLGSKGHLLYFPPLARASFYEVGLNASNWRYKEGLRRKLNIPKGHLLVLVMAGSAWIHRAEDYFDLLKETFSHDKVIFAFLCGKNQKFAKKILENFPHEPCFRVLSWLNEREMAEWMAAADFGLAFSLAQMAVEAGLVGLPIFIFRLIEGQEEGYREIIDEHGVGLYIPGTPEDQVYLLQRLLRYGKNTFLNNSRLWQKELMAAPIQTRKALVKLLKDHELDREEIPKKLTFKELLSRKFFTPRISPSK